MIQAKWKLWIANRWVPLSEQGAARWLSGGASYYGEDERLDYTDASFHHEWTTADVKAMQAARTPANQVSA